MNDLQEINAIYDKRILRTCAICYITVFVIGLLINRLRVDSNSYCSVMNSIRIFLSVLSAFPLIQVMYYSKKYEKISKSILLDNIDDTEYLLNVIYNIYKRDKDICYSKLMYHVKKAKEKAQLEKLICIYKSKSTVNNWTNNLSFASLAVATLIGMGSAIVAYNSTLLTVNSTSANIENVNTVLGEMKNLLYFLLLVISIFIITFYYSSYQQSRDYARLKYITFILEH